MVNEQTCKECGITNSSVKKVIVDVWDFGVHTRKDFYLCENCWEA